MVNDDAAKFRKQAEEAREHASRAVSQLNKEAWLRVAEEWLKLAVSAEERERDCGSRRRVRAGIAKDSAPVLLSQILNV